MRFGVFSEHQLPRPWDPDAEYRVLPERSSTPHSDSTWPKSRAALAEHLRDVRLASAP